MMLYGILGYSSSNVANISVTDPILRKFAGEISEPCAVHHCPLAPWWTQLMWNTLILWNTLYFICYGLTDVIFDIFVFWIIVSDVFCCSRANSMRTVKGTWSNWLSPGWHMLHWRCKFLSCCLLLVSINFMLCYVRSSFLYNGISYAGKMTSLYWIRAQVVNARTK